MRTYTATAASRGFSELLDAVEHGDSITITRGGHPVAELRPIRRYTVRELREQLIKLPPIDEAVERDIADALALIDDEVQDPWANA
ncbi:MAG: type II toxin-antitoxin system Phd/YefM family antitoxin [Pseudoclavibacter sp.]